MPGRALPVNGVDLGEESQREGQVLLLQRHHGGDGVRDAAHRDAGVAS